MRGSSWLAWAVERGKHVFKEDPIPKEVPKPYTVPEGWVAPTLGEQWRYAARRHPYYRYGTAVALMLGVLGWIISSEQKSKEQQRHGGGQQLQVKEGAGATATSSSGGSGSS